MAQKCKLMAFSFLFSFLSPCSSSSWQDFSYSLSVCVCAVSFQEERVDLVFFPLSQFLSILSLFLAIFELSSLSSMLLAEIFHQGRWFQISFQFSLALIFKTHLMPIITHITIHVLFVLLVFYSTFGSTFSLLFSLLWPRF